jgi:hypothetical protein
MEWLFSIVPGKWRLPLEPASRLMESAYVQGITQDEIGRA